MPDFNVFRDRPLFVGIDRTIFERFAAIAKYHEYQPRETIIREGEQKNSLMMIEKGWVEVLKAGSKPDSKDQKITTLGGSNKYYDMYQGDILGEMSLIDIEPASATVKTVTEVGIWSMDRMDLISILGEDMETYNMFIMNIARILSRRLRDTDKKLV